MTVEVDVRAGQDFAFARPFTLGGVRVVLDLRWHARLSRWIVMLTTEGDVALSMPHVVQSGGRILADRRDPRVPSGTLEWVGPDDYSRGDIGQTLRLVYRE